MGAKRMNPAIRWIGIIVAGLALAAAGRLGWSTGRAPLLTELANQDNAHTREKLRTFERTAEVLQDAQDRGDALYSTLAARLAEIDQLTKEKHHAIANVTTGRACLGGPALRLLSTAPGLSVSGLAQAPGGAAATDAAAATDTDNTGIVSTDSDIAGWAIDAGAQFEVCRARLDALIDWYLKPTTPTSPAAPDHAH